jgi:hypothetical protein
VNNFGCFPELKLAAVIFSVGIPVGLGITLDGTPASFNVEMSTPQPAKIDGHAA